MRTRMFAAVAAAALVLVPAQAALARGSDDPQAPVGTALTQSAKASGVQIYECAATTEDPSAFAYRFRAPAAQLQRDIIHYAGPTWQSTRDGSRVRGQLVPGGSFPNARPERNIPDLLLEVVEHAGPGVLGDVDFVIRRNSRGGVGPVGEACDPSVDGDLAVPYRATYEFYEMA